MSGRSVSTVTGLFLAVSLATSATAGPLPSKAEARGDDLARVQSVLDREEVAETLAANGLTRDEVDTRLAQLSDQDVAMLAANVDQVQAAGEVPQYIWILLAVLIGVTILATVF